MASLDIAETCAGKKVSPQAPQPAFQNQQVVLFAVPGAFTPTCSSRHLPGFAEKADEIKAKGVDTIGCVAVNDAFVMEAWGKAVKIEGTVPASDKCHLHKGVHSLALLMNVPSSSWRGARPYRQGSRNAVSSVFHACRRWRGAFTIRIAIVEPSSQYFTLSLMKGRGLRKRVRWGVPVFLRWTCTTQVTVLNLEEGGAFTMSGAQDILDAL
eukprot:198776-Prorocentrum_minimum.AAC.2